MNLNPSKWIGVPGSVKKELIADSVDLVISQFFPDKHPGLCFCYAIVGSTVLNECYVTRFLPVAGLAVLPTGGDGYLKMLDETAFSNPLGGAFHTWIESTGSDDPITVDFSYRNNQQYAETCGISWALPHEKYLWGKSSDLRYKPESLIPPISIPEDMVWYSKRQSGMAWLHDNILRHHEEYSQIVSLVLRHIYLGLADYKQGEKRYA